MTYTQREGGRTLVDACAAACHCCCCCWFHTHQVVVSANGYRGPNSAPGYRESGRGGHNNHNHHNHNHPRYKDSGALRQLQVKRNQHILSTYNKAYAFFPKVRARSVRP